MCRELGTCACDVLLQYHETTLFSPIQPDLVSVANHRVGNATSQLCEIAVGTVQWMQALLLF